MKKGPGSIFASGRAGIGRPVQRKIEPGPFFAWPLFRFSGLNDD